MKAKTFAAVVLIPSTLVVSGWTVFQKLDRGTFYAAIKSTSLKEIDGELSILSSAPAPEKEAFEGSLLMRKAGLVAIPAEKLKLFKSGRIKLESVLAKDSTITEYRFLRLIIQEHAPKIVKYYQQLTADKLYIQKTYKTQQAAVQQAIMDYSKSSKILHPQDL